MDDPAAAFGGFVIYVGIAVLLFVTGSTTGGIVWIVMAGIAGLAIALAS